MPRSRSVSPRLTRTTCGIWPTPMAIVAVASDGPRIAARPTARTRNGNASSVSVNRDTRGSRKPWYRAARSALWTVRRRSQHRTAHPDPWVDHRVEQVDQQIDADVCGRGHQHDPLDHRVVAGEHRVQGQLAEPGQDEDLLGDHRPGD